MARVRVCLPVRQGERYLREAMESVLAQTYGGWELVVSDNASTDATRRIARTVRDPRIRVLTRSEDIGLVRNLEACLEGAETEWVLFLSHDDRLHSRTLQQLLDGASDGVTALVGGVNQIDERGETLKIDRPGLPPSMSGQDLAAWSLALALNPAHWAATLWRRSSLETAGGLRPEAGPFFDWSLFLRVALQGRVRLLPEPLADCRVHPLSLTSRLGSPALHASGLMNALRDFSRLRPDFQAQAGEACRTLARRYSARSGESDLRFFGEARRWMAAPLPLGTRIGCLLRMLKVRLKRGPAAAPPPPAPPSAPR